ncbi:molybdopterin-dependent oxidoreductase [Microbacterium sp.]|uniref:molybdopterin-dependent oxidoreductase n=1 Tax=Microbacterium sp. TaxID=51671 RepID=UPI0025E101E4|nr:molybdopterin-dependent oxidoreductase [Microbacterium sp.]
MVFPTRPLWLYQVTQGLHITAGIACLPLLLAKLYAVFPQLFQSPPVRSVAHLLERASIALFVAASLVQVAIGLLNTYQLYALFGFSFRTVHFALSLVVIGSLAIHIGVKLPVIARNWSKRSAADAERDAPTDPDAVLDVPDELRRRTGERADAGVTGRLFAWIDRAPAPEPPDPRVRLSRRAFFATTATATGAVVLLTAGQSFRVLDPINVFAPRKAGVGPQGLPVNRTARAADVVELATAEDWTLTVANGATTRVFDYAALTALPQHDVRLPIACVEGWSQMANWSGPRLRDLMDEVGAPASAAVRVVSLQTNSRFGTSQMTREFVRDDLTLVALRLEGEVLDIDHGFPARIIAPARPGVLQTKWLSRLEVM